MRTKTLLFFVSAFCLFCFSNCQPDELDSSIKTIDEVSDYELVNGENDPNLSMSGTVSINFDRLKDSTATTKFVNRCIDVWYDMAITKYVHANNKVLGINHVYDFDCSGFAGEIILKEVLPDHFKDLDRHRGTIPKSDTIEGGNLIITRPLAGSMYDYFRNDILESTDSISASNDFWMVFTSILMAKRGDLLVAWYDDIWRKKQNNSTTGHVMIVWDIDYNSTTNEATIQVLDCSSSPHTPSIDTRSTYTHPYAIEIIGSNGKYHHRGIGFGKMTFKISTNKHNRPYAYTWSLKNANSEWYNLMSGDDITESES